MSVIATRDFAVLLEAVEALGGTAPAAVRVVLETSQEFAKVASVQAGGSMTPQLLAEAIQGAVEAGQPLSFEAAWVASKKAAVTQLVRQEVGDHLGALDYNCALLVQDMLRGDEGHDMFRSLQPAVDEAIKGIEAASEHYGPESSLAEVVERGDEAVAAWRGAQAHERKLDQLLNTVVRPTRFVELIDPALLTDLGPYWMAAFFMARAVGDYTQFDTLVTVGKELDRSGVAWKVPGGRWLFIYRLCGLRLNSPAEAAELLKSLQQGQYAELQRHTPRQAGPQRQGAVDAEELQVQTTEPDGFEEVVERDPRARAGARG
jgi:hypothetical protein